MKHAYSSIFEKVLHSNGSIRLDKYCFNLEEMNSISRAITLNNKLTDIDLSNNQISEEKANFLFEELKANNHLKKLNLFNNNLEDEGMKSLSDTLALNSSLEYLNINNNKITEIGVKYLSKGLRKNSSLKILILSNNKIDDEGMRYLSDSLDSNQSLAIIDLSRNCFKENGLKYFYNSVKNKNKSLRISFFCGIEIQKTFLLKKIDFLLDCNSKWDPNNTYYLCYFNKYYVAFLLSLKILTFSFTLKIPKFVILEILKRIDRKSFLQIWKKDKKEEELMNERKRKRN